MNQLPPSDAILERIAKLLALAADASNEHEAALAASRANDLLFKHNLTQADLESTGRILGNRDPVGEHAAEAVFANNKVLNWKIDLFEAVATTNFCKVLYYQRYQGYRVKKLKTAALVGRAANVEVANYIYGYLVRELQRLAEEHADERMRVLKAVTGLPGSQLRGRKNHYRHSFLKGAAQGAAKTLYAEWQERRQANAESTALVVNEAAAVSNWVAEKYGKLGHSKIGAGGRKRKIDGLAYVAGEEAGKRVQVRKGLNQAPVTDESRLLR